MLARDVCLRVGAEKTVGAKRFIGSCRWKHRRSNFFCAVGIHAGCGARDKWSSCAHRA